MKKRQKKVLLVNKVLANSFNSSRTQANHDGTKLPAMSDHTLLRLLKFKRERLGVLGVGIVVQVGDWSRRKQCRPVIEEEKERRGCKMQGEERWLVLKLVAERKDARSYLDQPRRPFAAAPSTVTTEHTVLYSSAPDSSQRWRDRRRHQLPFSPMCTLIYIAELGNASNAWTQRVMMRACYRPKH